ncbi:MAG: hypothetical protein LUC83_03780 [Clostridiales bacterium]|nr:hypothetical protein [Clostridiales bacterium]
MKKSSLWKRGTGLLLAGVLACGAPATVFASQTLGDAQTENEQTGSTEVEGEVKSSSPGDPSYVITIPAKIDFGTLRQPSTDTDSFKDVSFTVTASDFYNIASGSAVAVLLKDSNDVNTGGSWSGEFAITKDTCSLEYSILNSAGTSVAESTLTYDHGLLFAVYANEGKVAGTARLNQRQLYGKDLKDTDSDYVGTYTGTIDFYAKVVSLAEYLSE